MSEAQRGAVGAAGNGGIGGIEEVAQQIGLRIVDTAAGDGGLAREDVPAGIVVAPQVVDFFVGEEIVEVHILELVVALHVAGNVEHLGHEALTLDAVGGKLRVADERGKKLLGSHILLGKVLDERCAKPAERSHKRIGEVHVIHIVLASIGGDVEVGVERLEHIGLVEHRQDAADDHRGLGIDMGIAPEHLGEVLIHAPCYALMLLGADVAEFAQSQVGGIAQLPQDLEHLLPTLGEHLVTFGLFQFLDGIGVAVVGNEPAATVTAIVVDEEGFITLGSRREHRQVLVGIGMVVIGADAWVGLELGAGVGQRVECKSRESKYQK